MRLAEAVVQRIVQTGNAAFSLRGVACMSQCKRSCIMSLSAPGGFTYVFGDLDPERPDHVDALLELVSRYRGVVEGFLERNERPESLRENILGRLPPIKSTSALITPLDMGPEV